MVLDVIVYLGYGSLIVGDVFLSPLLELIVTKMTTWTTIDNSLRKVAP